MGKNSGNGDKTGLISLVCTIFDGSKKEGKVKIDEKASRLGLKKKDN